MNTYLHYPNTIEDIISDNLTGTSILAQFLFQLRANMCAGADKNITIDVIYATTALTGEPGVALLDEAVQLLLQSSEGHATAQVLWAMRYEQSYSVSETAEPDRVSVKQDKSVVVFPRSPHDLALEDSVMERVRRAWQLITARDEEAGEFMVFEDREGTGDDEGEEE